MREGVSNPTKCNGEATRDSLPNVFYQEGLNSHVLVTPDLLIARPRETRVQ